MGLESSKVTNKDSSLVNLQCLSFPLEGCLQLNWWQGLENTEVLWLGPLSPIGTRLLSLMPRSTTHIHSGLHWLRASSDPCTTLSAADTSNTTGSAAHMSQVQEQPVHQPGPMAEPSPVWSPLKTRRFSSHLACEAEQYTREKHSASKTQMSLCKYFTSVLAVGEAQRSIKEREAMAASLGAFCLSRGNCPRSGRGLHLLYMFLYPGDTEVDNLHVLFAVCVQQIRDPGL